MTNARGALDLLVAAARDGSLDVVCERHGVVVLSAFGSATRAGPGEPRDLDVGVCFEHTMNAAARARARLELWTALTDLTDYERVDVVPLDVDDPVLRAEALTGVPLYEREPGQYAEAQIAAVGERRDTAYLRRRNLELMAR